VISSLNGIVSDISLNTVTVDVSGVGYSVQCSKTALQDLELGTKARFTIYTDVREDDILLYGFKDKLERQVFLLLKTVKGVGSKIALEMISQVNTLELLRAIGFGDTARLQSLKGVGKKTSERIIVELKEKVGEFAIEQAGGLIVETIHSDPIKDAESALMALGFSQSIAAKALAKVQHSEKHSGNVGKETGDLVREALQYV